MNLPSTMQVLERGWLSSNNILFAGRTETALVDTGYATHAAQTVALVGSALAGRTLDRIVNTHLHSDHCGGNAALQAHFGSRITVPADEAATVAAWDENALTYRETGQQCERFSFDDTIADGDTIMLGDLQWEVKGSPGHDPHSLVLYCRQERILISADALWENGFGIVFPELEGEPGFAATRSTLEMIAGLDIQLVIPGHGAPFTDAKKALATAFSRLDYLAADPRRNAEHAVKVLLKFLLLEKQSLPLSEVAVMFAGIPLFAAINRHALQLPEEELAQWAVAQLVRVGAAAVDGERLVNVG